MAKSEHVGFRANKVEDKDILDDLKRFKDKTGRLKDVYRKVLAMEAMAFESPTEVLPKPVPAQSPTVVAHTVQPSVVKQESQAVVWNVPQKDMATQRSVDWRHLPDQPTVSEGSKDSKKIASKAVEATMLTNFE